MLSQHVTPTGTYWNTLPEVETVVFWIAVSYFCVYRNICVSTCEEQRNNFSCHSSDDNYFLLLFCACVWCMHVHVFPVWVGQPTHCSALSFVHLQASGYLWLLSSAFQLLCYCCPLLSLPLLHCLLFFSFPTEPEKAKEKLLEKSLFLSIMLQPSLLAYITREGVFVPIIASLLCKWGFVFALVSSVPFPPITQFPLVGHLLWLQSHLRYIEISDSKHLVQTVWNTPRWAFYFQEPKQAAGLSCVCLNVSEECLKQLVLE